ncbi:ferric reductase transmembrane component 2 precursor [Pseudohyphozyma bogoriensis]|nr:ferric reductase transmembrane component 2 precursor [Pseudohyphozyma bogoriensis]
MATVTAAVVSSYVPPFATATAAATTAAAAAGTSLSFASVASYSGASSGTKTTSASIVDATGGVDSSSLLEYFTKPYLDAHVLSRPSWRYSYIFWIIVVFTLVVWSLAYQLSGPGGGAVGAWFRKWSIRRIAFGGKLVPTKDGVEPAKGDRRRTRMWASPTIAQMMAVVGLIGLALGLSLIGPDYISPTTCAFGGKCSYNSGANSGPPTSSYKRALDATFQSPIYFFGKRGVNNPGGWVGYTDPLLSAPNTDVQVSVWSAADRLGLISYAMFPLVITLAVKQWPWNIWATPWLTNYHFDKTAILHRWSGRVIWLFSSAHTGAWFYELIIDKDPFGRSTIIPVLDYFRFVAGLVAYGVLTLLVILSFSPFRNRHYELFYWSHVVLVILFLVGCLIHTNPLSFWPIMALGIWGAERATRLILFFYVNGFAASFGSKKEKRASVQSFSVLGSEKVDNHSEGKGWTPAGTHSPGPHAYPPSPYQHDDYPPSYPPSSPSSQRGKRSSYYAYGPGQDMSYLEEHQYPRAQPQHANTGSVDTEVYGHLSPAGPDASFGSSTTRHDYPSAISSYKGKASPGFATAQLLPGRTVRLTLNVPRAVRWRPGQHIILTVPSVKFIQGHPYTITNVDERAPGIAPLGGSVLKSEGTEIVLLIRAQKGFSKALWDYVVKQRQAKESAGVAAQDIARGVQVRALVSLPMGSAGRVTWDDYESVLIICGGTGVTFGTAVLEYACRRLARQTTTARGGGAGAKPAKTTRVRQLQFDLFVSRDLPSRLRAAPAAASPYEYGHAGTTDELAPPRPAFAQQEKRSPSRNSLESDWSDSDADIPSPPQNDVEDSIDSVTDLVLFDGEDDHTTPAELAISSKIRTEGKLRRAKSRRDQGFIKRPSRKPQPLSHSRGSSVDADAFEHGIGLAEGQPRFPRNDSFADNGSFAELGLGRDDQSEVYSLAGGGTSSIRQLIGGRKRRSADDGSEAILDVTEQDQEDLDAMAELARPGHPKLGQILDDEVQRSTGKTIVACCGPVELNTTVRHLVSDRINIAKVLRGDPKGQVALVCEDFSF